MYAGTILVDHLEGSLLADRHHLTLLGRGIPGGDVGDLPCEGVRLEERIDTTLTLQPHISRWQGALSLRVGVSFIVEAALQLGTLTRQLLRIDGNVL